MGELNRAVVSSCTMRKISGHSAEGIVNGRISELVTPVIGCPGRKAIGDHQVEQLVQAGSAGATVSLSNKYTALDAPAENTPVNGMQQLPSCWHYSWLCWTGKGEKDYESCSNKICK